MTRPPAGSLRAALALAVAIGLAGCSAASTSPGVLASAASVAPSAPTASGSPDAGASANPSVSAAAFSCALPIHVAATVDRAQISDVAVGTQDGYDQIAFRFVSGLPDVTVETAIPPFVHDASGLAIAVEGSSFLKIILRGGTAQTLGGGSSYSGARSFTPRFAKLVDVQAGGDFEAVATWYVGMAGNALRPRLERGGAEPPRHRPAALTCRPG
jgi:hypothetical protein